MATTHPGRRPGMQPPVSDPSRKALAFTIVLGCALTAALWAISGPPALPTSADWAHLRATLAGSELTSADVVTIATAIAWLALGYLALTVGLRAIAVTIARITGGARWARGGLSLTSLITIPAVRRVVDGGVGGTLLVMSWLPDASRAAAATQPAVVMVTPIAAPTQIEQVDDPLTLPSGDRGQEAAFIEYTVVRGDYLWDIARRFYGDGSRYVELWELNRGRMMAGGERFTDPRVIRPGWVLQVPLPAASVALDAQSVVYRVARGDDLWSIAARFMGDGFRWTEIWELNRHEAMGDGRTFSNPNVLHAGWRLRLPIPPSAAPAPVEPLPVPEPEPALPATPAAEPYTDMSVPFEPAADLTPNPSVGPEQDGGLWDWPTPSAPVLFTVAGFALIGGAVLSVYRLRRSGALLAGSGEAPRMGGGGDAGRVTLATEAVASAIAERGFDEARVALVFERGDRLRFIVERIPWTDSAIASLQAGMARRLACRVEAAATAAGRIEITLTGVNRLAATLTQRTPAPSTLVVPVGAQDDEIVYLNLAAGGLRLSGEAARHRAHLRSWVTTLVATHSPADLALRVDAQTASLLEELAAAPHLAGSEAGDVSDLLEELDEIIQARLEDGGRGTPVVALIDGAEARRGALAAVLRDGPGVGVHLIVAGASDLTGTFDVSLTPGGERDGLDDLAVPGASDPSLIPGPGQVILQRKGEPGLVLDPVLVRRDDSPRWKAGAELAASLAVPPDRRQRPDRDRVTHRPQVVLETVEDLEVAQPDDARSLLAEASEHGDGTPRLEAAGTNRPDPMSVTTHAPMPAIGGPLADPPSTDFGEAEPDGDDDLPGETDTVAKAEPAVQAGSAEQQDTTSWEDEGHMALLLPVAAPVRDEAGVRQASLLLGDTDVDGARCAEGRPPFTVRCLGPFEVTVGGARIDDWKRPKAPELIAFLVARGSTPVSREAVAAALWPEFPWDPGIDHMLANAASAARAACRAALGESGVQVLDTPRRGILQLRATLFTSDLDEFEAALRRAARLEPDAAFVDYDRAFELYRGDFLEGVHAEWTDDYRHDYRMRYVEAARRAAGLAVACGDVERAIRYSQLMLGQEPTDETVARDLMRLLASVGDINGARKVYKLLGEALQRELDDPRAAPAPDTRMLLSELVGEAVDA